jgi:hypothetical protein
VNTLYKTLRPHFFFVMLFFITVVVIAGVVGKTQGPHGGYLKKVGTSYIEMKTVEKKLYAYLLDKKLKTVSNRDIVGEARFFFSDSSTTSVSLLPQTDNSFTCGVPGEFFACKITLRSGGHEISALFDNTVKVVKK